MRPRLGALAVALAVALGASNCGNGGTDPPDPRCGDLVTGCEPLGQVCRNDTCIPPPTPCASNVDCTGDRYCETSTSECLPWGFDAGPESDPTCTSEATPGVFLPGVQCEWLGPPAGDAFPGHVNVLATPMVATLYTDDAVTTPSIVFTSYNGTDGGGESCIGTNPALFGVLRVIDGRTCAQQATIASPPLIATASVAIGDLGGDATPEIVAARADGGLVAFTLRPAGWEVLWQTASRFADNLCDFAGPAIHDLDDDGVPEVVFYGAVYDAAGNTLDESIAGAVDSVGTGYVPIIADVDGDGVPDLVTGSQLYSWDKAGRRWVVKKALAGANGHTAVADFGTFPKVGQDVRGQLDGVAEIVVVFQGTAKVLTVDGREVFSATFAGGAQVGGPPTIADFDHDGRVEFGAAGATGFHVFDPDCRGTPSAATCPSLRTDGISWIAPSQDASNTTGSTAFDFDGDGRAEAVYGDECFTRIYDGATGQVLASRFRRSCTRYESPVVADADGDFAAELVSTSNTNCTVTCPQIDPQFDGVQCRDSADCPAAAPCGREQPGDALGRCRCGGDADCGDGYACRDPIGGASPAGKVCRASRPAAGGTTGVRVLADSLGRWRTTRAIWNQHAFAITNIDDDGHVPRTSQLLANWRQQGLNNFRQSSFGAGISPGGSPDLTILAGAIEGATIHGTICNRGAVPVGPGVPVSFYDGAPPVLRCTTVTAGSLVPGSCEVVSCPWTGEVAGVVVVADDAGYSAGIYRECREDNNQSLFVVP